MAFDLYTFLLSFPQLQVQKMGSLLVESTHHRVYSYGKDQIIKVPRRRFEFLYSDKVALLRDLAFLQKHFPGLAIKTEVLSSKNEEHHIILQERVNQTYSVTKEVIQRHSSEFKKLLEKNSALYKDTGCSLDFLGGAGVNSCLRSLFDKQVVPHCSNLMIKDGKLCLVDTELHRVYLSSVSLHGVVSYILALFSHHTNVLFLRLFFRVASKRIKDRTSWQSSPVNL